MSRCSSNFCANEWNEIVQKLSRTTARFYRKFHSLYLQTVAWFKIPFEFASLEKSYWLLIVHCSMCDELVGILFRKFSVTSQLSILIYIQCNSCMPVQLNQPSKWYVPQDNFWNFSSKTKHVIIFCIHWTYLRRDERVPLPNSRYFCWKAVGASRLHLHR